MTNWNPQTVDPDINTGQIANKYIQLVDLQEQLDNESNPTEQTNIRNSMIDLNIDSFFVDDSTQSNSDYGDNVLEGIKNFLEDMESYVNTTPLAASITGIAGKGLSSYFSKVKGQKQMMTKRSQLSKPISPPVQTFSGLGSYFSKVKQKQSKYIRF